MPRLRFRYRIGLLVALAGLALVGVTAVTLVVLRHSQQQLTGIETRYVPLIELDRDLKTAFAEIPRALEDAAAAAEDSRLADADTQAADFERRLGAGEQAILHNGGDPRALAAEFRQYFTIARQVSAAIVAGTPAAQLGSKVEDMRRAQQAFAAHLDAATRPDHQRLADAFSTARESQDVALWTDIVVAAAVLAVMAVLSWRLIRRTVRSLHAVSQGVERLARGEFAAEIDVPPGDEIGDLAVEANRTAVRLRAYREEREREAWIKTGLAELAEQMAGELEPIALGRRAMTYLAKYVGAEVAVAYVANDSGGFEVLDTYGVADATVVPRSFQVGEGVAGQAARDDELRVLDVPPEYLAIRSALGAVKPRHVVIVPLVYEERAMGVLELALLEPPTERALELMQRTRAAVGVALRVAESRQRAKTLLAETQRQGEELRAAYATLEARNATLVSTQQQLEERADELARASRYKSEFLANMSHELRTPLNSIMLLSKVLSDDEDRRLTAKQIEFATLIHRSGEELLALINEVLDLAKVESGKQTFEHAPMRVDKLADYTRRMFTPLATQKGLAFDVDIEAGVPAEIVTDWTRLTQIIKNLASNAFKFTERGRVAVRIWRPTPQASPAFLDHAIVELVVISVSDTGIGIAPDKQAWIFEAFAQAETGTSRKFGGTGLGLTIAKQLAVRLGGDLAVESEVGIGATFHLVLPAAGPPGGEVVRPERRAQQTLPPLDIADDRQRIAAGEPSILVIEDDRGFGSAVLEIARAEGFKGIVSTSGREGLDLARRYQPSGIVLDVGLPDIDGWAVMEALKLDPKTADIPVHFITAARDADRARRLGAVGFTSKPIEPGQLRGALRVLEAAHRTKLREILVVEPDGEARSAIQALLAERELEVTAVSSAREALARLSLGSYGCVVVNLALPDKQAGLKLVAAIRGERATAGVPIVVDDGVELSPDEVTALEADERTVVVVRGERSLERLIDEARQFVHRVRSELPRPAMAPAGPEPALDGKTVLIVDDDMRNVYSLSHALRAKHLHVITAADGQEALDELARSPAIDLVLMDVMMPRMDGHEAMRRIREQERFRALPIIALTARTLAGEREKCLEAGANDYVPKPIDVVRLFGLLKAYLA